MDLSSLSETELLMCVVLGHWVFILNVLSVILSSLFQSGRVCAAAMYTTPQLHPPRYTTVIIAYFLVEVVLTR